MVRYRLFIEGGGRADSDADTEQMNRAAMVDDNAEAFRRGWQTFFRKAGVDGQTLEIGVGGGQNETFALFSGQLAHYDGPDETEPKPLMLIDSEEPVASGHTPWEHLQSRRRQRFQRPADADDHSAFLMAQAMETWFIADRPALQRFFGPSFNEREFQDLPALETIPKDDALQKLRQSTGRCRPRYRKGRVSYDLLAEINPARVAAACPHAQELLDYLRGLNP